MPFYLPPGMIFIWWHSPPDHLGLVSSVLTSSFRYYLGISYSGAPIGTYTWRRMRSYIPYSNLSSSRCSTSYPPSLWLWRLCFTAKKELSVGRSTPLYMPSFEGIKCCYVQAQTCGCSFAFSRWEHMRARAFYGRAPIGTKYLEELKLVSGK